MKNLFDVIFAYAIENRYVFKHSNGTYGPDNGAYDIIKIKHLIDENDYNDIIDYYKNLDVYKDVKADFNYYITVDELLEDMAKIYNIDFILE